ncbi:MAG TPA: hypothetical protein VHU81_02800 [Thermoanaerobaculia bacterium]|jgi:uncharacterized membrane protein|nr:hypothetical protein [Thermoanaerobaculia bacterium]
MSEPTLPPPPPPSYTPPPPPTGPSTGGPVSSNRTLMLVLSYLGILAVIPFVAEKEDREVQWHAKNGLLLLALDVAVILVITVLSHIPVLGCAMLPLLFLLPLGLAVLHIVGIVKALNGDRFIIPGVSQYVDRF